MRCLCCETEEAFRAYRERPSGVTAHVAYAKFSTIMRFKRMSGSEKQQFTRAIVQCPRHNNEPGLDNFIQWMVAEHDELRRQTLQTRCS